MVSATDVKSAAMTGTVKIDGDTVRVEAAPVHTHVYYLLWRKRPSQPWHSEEFDNRNQAHHRYFALAGQGVEAYLEKRPSRVTE
ncbi:MAG: hypothetical protein L0211_19270 [Planctomycetaceae bacterium]|nr:hypothetical protein [Planctomycetaceae bacterium]